MSTTAAEVTMTNSNGDYALGYTNFEHERLIRQAARIAPYTERLFREAGVGPGQRVLDLGSGVGDVSMLLARIVGPAGEVIGIERDAGSIARANARVAEAGFTYTNYCGGLAASAAADWVSVVDVCGGNLTTTLVPSTAPHGGKYMIHVVTDSVNSGIGQSEGFANQAKVLSSVWVYVNSGCVGIGTGNAAFTVDTDEITCESGTWIQFKLPNSGSPANTFVVYAFPLTGADYYVDNARVVAVP